MTRLAVLAAAAFMALATYAYLRRWPTYTGAEYRAVIEDDPWECCA